jgi:hypothetical protein
MKIKYQGKAGIRKIPFEGRNFVWAADVDYGAEVPANLAAELLTYPRDEFVVDVSEPLLQLDGIGIQIAVTGSVPAGEFMPLGEEGIRKLQAMHARIRETLGNLALAGIGSVTDLAVLDDAGVEALTEATGFDEKQVKAWVKQANRLAAKEG